MFKARKITDANFSRARFYLTDVDINQAKRKRLSCRILQIKKVKLDCVLEVQSFTSVQTCEFKAWRKKPVDCTFELFKLKVLMPAIGIDNHYETLRKD
jgi:hypothetical protein